MSVFNATSMDSLFLSFTALFNASTALLISDSQGCTDAAFDGSLWTTSLGSAGLRDVSSFVLGFSSPIGDCCDTVCSVTFSFALDNAEKKSE